MGAASRPVGRGKSGSCPRPCSLRLPLGRCRASTSWSGLSSTCDRDGAAGARSYPLSLHPRHSHPVRRHAVRPRRQQRDRVIPGPQLSSRSATGGLQSITSTPGELTSIAPAGGRLRSGPAGYSFAVIDLGACLTKSSLLRLAATGPASGAAAPSTTSESPASTASTAPTASLLSSSRRRRRADPEPD